MRITNPLTPEADNKPQFVRACSNDMEQTDCCVRDLELALANGASLDEFSLLKIILARHLNETEPGQVAKNLLARFEKLGKVIQSDLNELLDVDGLNLAAATAIIQFRQIAVAIWRTEAKNRILLRNQSSIIDYCLKLFCHAEREMFHVLFFNKRGELLAEECLQRGTIDHVSVYPRELLRMVIRHNASYVVLTHNHPAGDFLPSQSDIAMTRELSQLLRKIGARVFDHVIVSAGRTFSFRQDLSSSGKYVQAACNDALCD